MNVGSVKEEDIDNVLLNVGKLYFGEIQMDTKIDINKPSKFWETFESVFHNDAWRENDFFKIWQFKNLWDVKNYIICRLF